ncbi:MAG: methylated-DNA--[protein]-cysteine S-methyltransferase [Deltaproteobacteria bacterium]|jgi:methylated-DNA-protein-cysteine methyltransferase-like protein|nr:methylated-DNA--[protein]-cysteine S-methyltransferase [Deltaproteobacteria bacterium]
MSSGFFARVYELVAIIPPGRVMTYGQISAALQSPYSAKLVGFAMSAAPAGQALPCHRVINRLGEMSPAFAFGGENTQQSLLEAEGTPFLPNGRINLELARFEPSQEQLEQIEAAFT